MTKQLRGAIVGMGCVLLGTACLVYALQQKPTPTPEPDLAAEAEADLATRNFRPLSGDLQALLDDSAYKSVPTQAHPHLGQLAPDFTLPDTNDTPTNLKDMLAKGPVVVVFYYGYYCNHCVSQLFALHKDEAKFRELGATIIAISADPPKDTRERFQKYGDFAFPVLSDTANNVATKYGTYTPSKKPKEDGELMHGTFVISKTGRIVWTNRGDSPFTDNRTLLRELRAAK